MKHNMLFEIQPALTSVVPSVSV